MLSRRKRCQLLFLTASGCLLIAVIGEGPCDKCAQNAKCESLKCQCPEERPGGLPDLHCVGANEYFCSVTNEGMVRGFTGAETTLKIPCKIPLAHFDTDETSRSFGTQPGRDRENFVLSDPQIGRCRIVLHGNMRFSRFNQYYLSDIFVMASINRGYGIERWVFIVGNKKGGCKWMYNNFETHNMLIVKPGDCTDMNQEVNSKAESNVTVCHATDNSLWKFEFADCGSTSVVFRNWDEARRDQLSTSGVFISLGQLPIINMTEKDTMFPKTVCDLPRSTEDVYEEYNKEKGVHSDSGILLPFLDSMRVFAQSSMNCTVLPNGFQRCPATRRVEAVNTCYNMTSKEEWAACSKSNNQDPVGALAECIHGYCSGRKEKCDRARSFVINEAEPMCPDDVDFKCDTSAA